MSKTKRRIRLELGIGDQLRAAISRSELGAAEIARRAELDAGHLSRFRSGVSSIGLERVEALCRVLGLELTEIKRPGRRRARDVQRTAPAQRRLTARRKA